MNMIIRNKTQDGRHKTQDQRHKMKDKRSSIKILVIRIKFEVQF